MAGILQVLSTNIVPSYTPPEFVSSGLVAYYDPSNSLSYSGTGSTFNDLSKEINLIFCACSLGCVNEYWIEDDSNSPSPYKSAITSMPMLE